MNIHVLNHELNALADVDLDAVCHAVHRQVAEHVGPAWGVASSVRRVRHVDDVPAGGILAVAQAQIDVDGALAYHTVDGSRPQIVVSAELAARYGSTLGECLSHEVLEALCDLFCNSYAPDDKGRWWVQEICDPVQELGYEIGGVRVSDFVLPAWFSAGSPGPWSHLGTLTKAYQVSKGGYAQYWDGQLHQVHGSEASVARADLRAAHLGPVHRGRRIAAAHRSSGA